MIIQVTSVLRSDQLLVTDFLTSWVEVIFIDYADDLCSGSWHSNLYPLVWVLFHDLCIKLTGVIQIPAR